MQATRTNSSLSRIALIVIFYHLIIFISIASLEYVYHGNWLNGDSVVKWDAAHYLWIAQNGYVSFRQAFFPLLPFVWRLLSFDPIGISALNATLYLTSLIFLSWRLHLNTKTLLVWIILPSTIFYFVPYTESIFFASTTLVLFALGSRSRNLVTLGLILCTLCRPAFTTLVPSVLLVAFVFRTDGRKFLLDSTTYIIASAIGLFIVSLVQHHFTGDWLGFFTAQKAWGNQPQLPSFPLSSWGGQAVTRLDAVAFLFGLTCAAYLCKILWGKMRSGKCNVTPEVLLSCGCLSSITLLTLFFRGGELFSLNRFVFATPFAVVLLDHAMNMRRPLSLKHYALGFVGLMAFFMVFGAYVHIQTLLKFALLALYVLMTVHVLFDQHQTKRWFFGIWFCVAACIQVYFAYSFLNDGWVG